MLKHTKKVRNKSRKKGDQPASTTLGKLFNGPTVLNKTSGVTIVAKGSFDFESVV
ncbi:hypothetical protein GK047_03900 [Paenibacillus sp. SYP-B3998]|uniref:Uncharacterized protein n=1 Tax=Paenibacillus sp. SYP-B3998 TaxID=2678564 RepID=A0A6G3ZSH9_9BACL|nr:hypothetical protein [Paenibacillus sp. SYP-B3998]NEW05163.1 hypothetical protein [Paenibacillus sp. SYP-B3998]